MRDAETKKERKARLKAEKKANKVSFTMRMKNRGRETVSLGKTLVNEPREFPGALQDVFRRSFRTIWNARGGGLYACGYVLTFIVLEIKMFFGDILDAESIGGFFGEQLFEMLFRFLGESIQNMVFAFIWPVWFIQYESPWGLVMLVLMFVVFSNFLKAPLEQWLFKGAESPLHSADDS